jgi:hypothetical protein
MTLVRLLCIACILLFVAGTVAWQISRLVSVLLLLATVVSFLSACLVKTK